MFSSKQYFIYRKTILTEYREYSVMLNIENGQLNGQLAGAALISEHQALSSLGLFALLAKGNSGNMVPKVFLSSKITFFFP